MDRSASDCCGAGSCQVSSTVLGGVACELVAMIGAWSPSVVIGSCGLSHATEDSSKPPSPRSRVGATPGLSRFSHK
eukprot:CAMPEP_0119302506 /NCGR_PEP_ID=MMETSP1333-20130426/4094_1 /TAXON_ID=418940 /ORGANISM="Scyphosphaera apsteinii, Strain RCC1455" /LENGTH=75 /DNA_ID=CAMNT_0007304885 /DNA_START=104 /DNA_END=331 /DNA_ORIENTATION=+